MSNATLSLFYGIGSKAKTREYLLSSERCFEPLQKQNLLSFPLITSITVRATLKDQQRKSKLFSIYVGKELRLDAYNDYYIEKYGLDADELMRFRLEGYERVCLLNYKKYDVVMVGLHEEDKVVPDYFALKRDLAKLKQLQMIS
ncbi:MAG: hypothetical protein HFI09_03420 [Bacilli bacterium]|nr:hypothetical protein [Bacilli bacterium]